MKLILNKPDTFGAIASAICLVHCVATPLIFIVSSCSLKGCNNTPLWWKSIDYIFLIISLIAIYFSTKTSTNNTVKVLLWLSWTLLFTVIINEKMNWFYLPEYSIYIPATLLIVAHMYNLKYCKCSTDKCCIKNNTTKF